MVYVHRGGGGVTLSGLTEVCLQGPLFSRGPLPVTRLLLNRIGRWKESYLLFVFQKSEVSLGVTLLRHNVLPRVGNTETDWTHKCVCRGGPCMSTTALESQSISFCSEVGGFFTFTAPEVPQGGFTIQPQEWGLESYTRNKPLFQKRLRFKSTPAIHLKGWLLSKGTTDQCISCKSAGLIKCRLLHKSREEGRN